MKAAALFVCAVLLASAPCNALQSMQQRGALPHGGSYVLDPDPTIGAAAIDLWFRAPGAGYDNTAPGISRLAATAAAAAPLDSGKSLVELVHSLGGVLTIDVYPDIVGIGAVVPSTAARRVVAAMTAAYFAPAINDESVKTAQRDSAVRAVEQRYSADQTLHDLLFKQIFSTGPAHYPPLPDSVSALTKVPMADIAAFAKRAFRSDNAILTASGNVDATTLEAVTDGQGSGSMDRPFNSKLSGADGATTEQGTIDGVGLAWVGPPIVDTKAATALDFISDYLFRDESGIVSKAMDAVKGSTYVSGQFVTLNDPGVMLVTISGDDTKTAKERVITELQKLEQPLDSKAFAAAREAFLYHIAADTQTPQGLADNLGWYSAEGNASYAPGDTGGLYENAARSLDPQYVAGIVQRYLKEPVVINLVQAKASAS
ncbi:MAG TPA: insulinase family protein [Candidatus Baltobacteraceae bacterium]|jgi:predicted Zn-dependent peptidase|nr:insulinase family protein [Candidatus Baltobacteraceae bacterium]